MDTVVLKFGGSSLADNIKLNIVANKIIEFYKKGDKVIVVVSAQGKTTDNLIKESLELTEIPDSREMDVLLSSGEQISISKLSIVLKKLGYDAISLTGWQAGIFTNEVNQNAKIEGINTSRIIQELDLGKIVIVAGFQGINRKSDITTLGRGGSDTSAIAVAAAIKAKECYIFSDVDGVYTADPKKIVTAKKIERLSYVEMLEIADEGARVLHNRCIEIGEKYNMPIITKSTFNNKQGSVVQEKIEDTNIKSIVKNDNIIFINLKGDKYSINKISELYKILDNSEISITNFINNSKYDFDVIFTIKSVDLNKFQKLMDTDLKKYISSFANVSKISIIGNGIMNNKGIVQNILNIIELNNLEIFNIEISSLKISILFKDTVPNNILEQLHKLLIES
ncbi:MAG: aspartate kinase [Clostridia bacterium]|nr:aspartate kinase [Clostridia bacterium]